MAPGEEGTALSDARAVCEIRFPQRYSSQRNEVIGAKLFSRSHCRADRCAGLAWLQRPELNVGGAAGLCPQRVFYSTKGVICR